MHPLASNTVLWQAHSQSEGISASLLLGDSIATVQQTSSSHQTSAHCAAIQPPNEFAAWRLAELMTNTSKPAHTCSVWVAEAGVPLETCRLLPA